MRNKAKSALATAGYSVNEQSAIAALIDYAAQNSGLEFGNYGDRRAYAQEARSISKDWRRVKAALNEAARDGVKDSDVLAAAPRAFSGRLELKPEGGGFAVHYCTGQYWPTEYRKAVASVLEAAAHAKRGARPPVVRLPETIAALKALNRENGGAWFDPSSMLFFGTRIESGVILGKYFVTSEQPPHGLRKFSARSFNDKGKVDTLGEFCSYLDKADAVAVIREHARNREAKAA